MRQTIAPNPNIPCEPGWCLAYVNEAFGVPKVYPSATSAWHGSKTKHTGRDFPPGVWVPVWYSLDTTPLGHVVLLAPDGSCYSTSDLTNIPHHHPSLADLEAYYAYYGMTLTYRGWTEDVEGTRVVLDEGSAAIAPQSANVKPIPEEWDEMATEQQIREIVKSEMATTLTKWMQSGNGKRILRNAIGQTDTDLIREVLAAVQEIAAKAGGSVAAVSADEVLDKLGERLAAKAG